MYAMLSLDLDQHATTEQRTKFYESLKEDQWVKLTKVTTTWYASFKSGATESGITQTTKNDVAKAARNSGVRSYEAVVNVSASKPESF